MLGWSGFWLLTFIWGSLFLFSHVGVESIDPLHLTFIRLGVAAIGLNAIMLFRRLPFPTDRNTLLHLGVAEVGGLMLPSLSVYVCLRFQYELKKGRSITTIPLFNSRY